MAKNTQQVQKTGNAPPPSVTQAMPDFMKGMQGQGTESIGMKDVETPRLTLLQSTSKQCLEREDCTPGVWFHTVLETVLPKRFLFVPVYIDQRYLLWRPMDDGGGILARADDAIHWSPANASFKVKINKKTKEVTWKTAKTVDESRLAEWGTYDVDDPNSQPAATLMYNVVARLPEFPEIGPAVITFQRTGVPTARKFMGKLKLSQAPSFGQQFEMSSAPETNGADQTYLVPKVALAGFVQDPAQFKEYQELYEVFKKEGLKIKDIEGAQEDVGNTTTGSGGSIDKDAKPAKDAQF